MSNPKERRRELEKELAPKTSWLAALRRFQDQHGREPSAEEARELAVAAGVPQSEEPDPGNGALDEQIREAEQAGDVTRSIALKRQKFLTH